MRRTMNRIMSLLSVIKQETTFPKAAFVFSIILVAGNLNAIVDSILHPEISYFDEEHFIVGGVYALLVSILFLWGGIYSARHKLEENLLRESEEKYRNIFDNAGGIIFTVNKDTLYTSLNPAFEKITGWQREEWLGKSFAPILHPDDLPKAVGILQKVMKGETAEKFELRAKKKSGEYFIGEFTAAPIRQGETVSVLGNVRDITERKKLEDQIKGYSEHLEEKVNERTKDLEEAKILAEAADKAKSEFLANMSHELTTPLNSIVGFSQVLNDGLYGELNIKQKEYVGNILSSGIHLTDLIEDILNLSKVESGIDVLNVSRFLLKDIFRSLSEMFKDEAHRRSMVLSFDIETDPDMEVEADSTKLEQIMFNLISNAVKFTPDGGSVSVEARLGVSDWGLGIGKEGIREKSSVIGEKELTPTPQQPIPDRDFIEISVADTGIGIRREDLSRLFQEFVQLESPYAKRYAGIGVGLILTKKLVKLHGGDIWVESEFGKGSKFTFVIPVRQKVIL